jgi:hypothetical protein
MAEYWMQHRFLPKGWEYLSGAQVREDIRSKIHAFHNAVNARLEKPCPPLQPVGEPDRHGLARDLQHIFEGLREEWGGAHLEWKRTGALLISLAKSGPT